VSEISAPFKPVARHPTQTWERGSLATSLNGSFDDIMKEPLQDTHSVGTPDNRTAIPSESGSPRFLVQASSCPRVRVTGLERPRYRPPDRKPRQRRPVRFLVSGIAVGVRRGRRGRSFDLTPPCPNRESALASVHGVNDHTRESLASHLSHCRDRVDSGCPHSRAARRAGGVAGAEFAVGADPAEPQFIWVGLGPGKFAR